MLYAPFSSASTHIPIQRNVHKKLISRPKEKTAKSVYYLCMNICMYVCMYICMYVCLYEWMYVFLYIYIYIYIYNISQDGSYSVCLEKCCFSVCQFPCFYIYILVLQTTTFCLHIFPFILKHENRRGQVK